MVSYMKEEKSALLYRKRWKSAYTSSREEEEQQQDLLQRLQRICSQLSMQYI